MKLQYPIAAVISILFLHAEAQCPRMTGAIINACNGSCSEGNNEALFFEAGDTDIPVDPANIVVTYGTSTPPSATYTDGFTANTAYVQELNDTVNAKGCAETIFYDAATAGTIPAGTKFMLMRYDPCFPYNFVDFCGEGPIYVLFTTDASWSTSGNFTNSKSTTSKRYFRTDFSNVTSGCVTDYDFTPSNHACGCDGDVVTWSSGGGSANNYENNGTCDPDKVILPVELISFEGKYIDGKAILTWATASEVNSKEFIIQKSADGKNFENIGVVPAKGFSYTKAAYLFYDENFSSPYYYRLAQLDLDENKEYSKIIFISSPKEEVKVFPNPVKDRIFVQTDAKELLIEVKNVLGQTLFTTSESAFSVADVPPGIYFLHILDPSKNHIHIKKILKY